MISLDENWTIVADTYSWELRKTFLKEVDEKVKNKQTNKFTKTGKKVTKEFTDSWWFPRISQCILKYREESLKELESLTEISKKLSHIEELLLNIKNDTFRPC